MLAGVAMLAGGLAGGVPAPAAAQPPAGPVQTTLPFSGLDQPFAVAVGAAGNVYVADNTKNHVLELPPERPMPAIRRPCRSGT